MVNNHWGLKPVLAVAYIQVLAKLMKTNLKKHLAVEELVVAGDEVPPVVAVQFILLPGLGD